MKLSHTIRAIQETVTSTVRDELRSNPEFRQADSVFARLENNLQRKIARPNDRVRTHGLLSRAIVAGSKAAVLIGVDAYRQYKQLSLEELVADATSITSEDHVNAFTSSLSRMPVDLREAPLRSLALHIPAIQNRHTQALAVRALRNGLNATIATTSDLSTRWGGIDLEAMTPVARYAIAGRAWRLSLPDQRERFVQSMMNIGVDRSETEKQLVLAMHPDDLQVPQHMAFDHYAQQLGFFTPAGQSFLNQRLVHLSMLAQNNAQHRWY